MSSANTFATPDSPSCTEVPTFLVTGHETTSTSTTWCLYAITRNPAIQRKLREELLTLDTETPTMEELNSLPYLEKVVHETLRLHAPVTFTSRVATRDDVLPVSQPYTDRDGNVCTEIPIAKGDRILIPIIALHTSKEIWGEDALEFKYVAILPAFYALHADSRRTFIGRKGGITRPRRSRTCLEFGAISSPSLAARTHASAGGSLSSR